MSGERSERESGGVAVLAPAAPAGEAQIDLDRATSPRRAVDVLAVLAKSDLQLRYGRGSFRFLKWVLDPLAALGVFLLLIALVLDRGGEDSAMKLACAIVPFQLITTTMANALQSVTLRGSIIVNMRFPRMLIPASSLVTELVAFTATLALIPVIMLATGIAPTIATLWLIPALIVTAIFAMGLAYPAALLGIWNPELQPFAGSAVRALFFLAPGLVALDEITGSSADILPFNPLTGLFEAYRDALLYGQAPAAWELLVPLGAALLLLAIFVPIYRRDCSSLAKMVG